MIEFLTWSLECSGKVMRVPDIKPGVTPIARLVLQMLDTRDTRVGLEVAMHLCPRHKSRRRMVRPVLGTGNYDIILGDSMSCRHSFLVLLGEHRFDYVGWSHNGRVSRGSLS